MSLPGTITLLSLKILGKTLTIASVYVPTAGDDNKALSNSTFKRLAKIKRLAVLNQTHHITLIGDFNTAISPLMDRGNDSRSMIPDRFQIRKIIDQNDPNSLVDVWRNTYPLQKSYSHVTNPSVQINASFSRIDFALVNRELLNLVQMASIDNDFYPDSHHKSITLHLDLTPQRLILGIKPKRRRVLIVKSLDDITRSTSLLASAPTTSKLAENYDKREEDPNHPHLEQQELDQCYSGFIKRTTSIIKNLPGHELNRPILIDPIASTAALLKDLSKKNELSRSLQRQAITGSELLRIKASIQTLYEKYKSANIHMAPENYS